MRMVTWLLPNLLLLASSFFKLLVFPPFLQPKRFCSNFQVCMFTFTCFSERLMFCACGRRGTSHYEIRSQWTRDESVTIVDRHCFRSIQRSTFCNCSRR